MTYEIIWEWNGFYNKIKCYCSWKVMSHTYVCCIFLHIWNFRCTMILGIVHLQKKILSSFTNPQPVWISSCLEHRRCYEECGWPYSTNEGHEDIWDTGVGLPEGHHMTLGGFSSVFLQNKQVCGWRSQHGTALTLYL